MHDAPVRQIISQSVMLRQAFIPKSHVANTPSPPNGKLGLSGMGKEILQDHIAFQLAQFNDAASAEVVDKQAFFSGKRVNADHRMDHRTRCTHRFTPFLLISTGVVFSGEALYKAMLGGQTAQKATKRFRQGIVRCDVARPARVTAARWQPIGGV
ncbi:hypothetical protein RvY_06197 [Ramazzottius varieornatus]|uniref:Uncharacterized protein n=1 Tax=Ramazzottius varieornatus TaxID=947166 RepID=A0A1D1UXR2_RAMVA|nr:hypothetical protein RvY_06197 [Ramazzottius varieornatus]